MLGLRPALLWALAIASPLVSAQLSGSVGPTTSRASKASKICNIMSYGGTASATADNGPAIASAWAACKSGGQVYIPSGSYGLSTFVSLTGGSKVSINLEGTIYRTGSTSSGNMIAIGSTNDFEFYSANSKGAIQGYGYKFHTSNTYGPRILRLTSVTNFSVHDIILVDSPAFHITLDTCTNGEVYNMIIRGGNRGGLDGVDVWGTNIWVHDVEVTNKDECVTVKSPASHILVESIYCNWSGGCAIGSLGASTSISNVQYNNVYTQNANQMMMIKSNGGSGSLTNSVFNNFIGHTNAYTLDLDSAWSSQTKASGSGVQYKNLTFSNWKGTCSAGTTRAPVRILCQSAVPCTGLTISGFNVWTESGSSEYFVCQNAQGSGACLKSSSTYTTTQTVTTMGSYSIATMPGELKSGLGLSVSIAIPAIPTSFFPNTPPKSALLG